jgi:hypothetical protein
VQNDNLTELKRLLHHDNRVFLPDFMLYNGSFQHCKSFGEVCSDKGRSAGVWIRCIYFAV